MTEQEKHDHLLAIMDVIEMIGHVQDMVKEIQQTPFEELTPETWAAIREGGVSAVEFLIEILKQSLMLGSKSIDNDALMSHLQAVLLSDD